MHVSGSLTITGIASDFFATPAVVANAGAIHRVILPKSASPAMLAILKANGLLKEANDGSI